MIKKLRIAAVLSLVFAALMTASAYAESMCETVGIISKDEAHVFIDAEADCVYVMQHPTSTASNIAISPSGLKSKLGSDNYTLSYVTADKKAAGLAVRTFYDGYVKAVSKTDSSNVLYIPIKMYKGEEQEYDFCALDTQLAGGTELSASEGVGGMPKPAALLTPPQGGISSADAIVSDYNSFSGGTYTCEFSVYVKDGAEAAVSVGNTDNEYTLLALDTDGTVKVNENGSLTAAGETVRGRWHRAALTYCEYTHKFMVYFDGILLGENSIVSSEANKLFFGVSGGNGQAAYADLVYYAGYYYNNDYYAEAELASADENVIINSEKMTVMAALSELESVDALKALLNTDAKEIFIDGGMKAGSKLVLVSEQGAFTYYTLAVALFCQGVEFDRADGELNVTASISNALSSPVSVTMVVVLKNSGGIITDVYFSDTINAQKGDNELSAVCAAAADKTAEVFFISDLEQRTAVFEEIYSE